MHAQVPSVPQDTQSRYDGSPGKELRPTQLAVILSYMAGVSARPDCVHPPARVGGMPMWKPIAAPFRFEQMQMQMQRWKWSCLHHITSSPRIFSEESLSCSIADWVPTGGRIPPRLVSLFRRYFSVIVSVSVRVFEGFSACWGHAGGRYAGTSKFLWCSDS